MFTQFFRRLSTGNAQPSVQNELADLRRRVDDLERDARNIKTEWLSTWDKFNHLEERRRARKQPRKGGKFASETTEPSGERQSMDGLSRARS
jgi:hypothetical protein